MFTIAGLGNPGEEYAGSRHNTGRIVVSYFAKQQGFAEFVPSAKFAGLISKGKIKKEEVLLLFPETFMNKSGASISKAVKSKKAAEQLVVVHDDLDIALGSFKITFDRGSGGHRGVESIIRALKTTGFIRIRVGISPVTPKGKIRKPKGESAVDKFIIGDFRPAEFTELKKVSKKIAGALEMITLEGRERAMNEFN
jgi:PTH1 family peptidyl-tRNA hydrolase